MDIDSIKTICVHGVSFYPCLSVVIWSINRPVRQPLRGFVHLWIISARLFFGR